MVSLVFAAFPRLFERPAGRCRIGSDLTVPMAKMSTSSYEYKLLGFSRELDWRPLKFVSPMPPARICSACGLVPDTTGSLPCGHLLCKLCYQGCLVDGVRMCPLDRDVCPEDGVLWRTFPAENLARRQVKCWNEANGCNVTAAASDITRHFQEDCEHHMINCPKCSGTVRPRDLCAHLGSCNGFTEPSAALLHSEHDVDERECQEDRLQDLGRALHALWAQDVPANASLWTELKALKEEMGHAFGASTEEMATLKAVLEERTSEMRCELEALSSSHNDRLNKLEQSAVALKGSCDTELSQVKEEMERSRKVAAEFQKKSDGQTAELAALNRKLEILKAQCDGLCVLTGLPTGVVEKLSILMNVLERASKEQLEEAARRVGPDSSAHSTTVAVPNMLAAVERRDNSSNQTREVEHGLNVAVELETLKACLVVQVDLMQARLQDLSAENKTLNDRLHNLSNSIDELKAWKDNPDESASRNQSDSACSAAVAGNAAPEKTEGAVSGTMPILRNIAKSIKSHSWVLKGLKGLKKQATKAGEVCYTGESVYLRGYCVSPGVVIKAQDGLPWLHFSLQVHKGAMDDGLRWPFDHDVKFSVVHPCDHKLQEIYVDSPNSASVVESGGKSVMNFVTSSFYLPFLEKGGYVKNNQLILKLELLLSR